MTDLDSNLAQQVAYYRARATEYDEWWLRQGRYDRGPEPNAHWFRDVDELDTALQEFDPRHRVIELAGGTGIWSEKLLRYTDELTVVDASAEMLAINENRLRSDCVRYHQVDLFDWVPSEQFDVVFFSFWLSHVPESKFEPFWNLVRAALAPNGRVFFIDSRREATSTSADHQLAETGSMSERRLNDGQTFNIYKTFYDTVDLEARLNGFGWNAVVRSTSRYFLYGRCGSADARRPVAADA